MRCTDFSHALEADFDSHSSPSLFAMNTRRKVERGDILFRKQGCHFAGLEGPARRTQGFSLPEKAVVRQSGSARPPHAEQSNRAADEGEWVCCLSEDEK